MPRWSYHPAYRSRPNYILAAVSYTDRDRALALAAVFQTALAVQQIARLGAAEVRDLEVLIYGLFQTDPSSVEGVFGQITQLASGARTLVEQLGGRVGHNLELTRYVIQILILERKLSTNGAMLEQIAAGLADARVRLAEVPLLDPDLLALLADLYSRTLSRLQPRIIVHGEPRHLQIPTNVHRIRALLLAGVRAAVLYRQCGGRGWKLLFSRRPLLLCARSLASQPPTASG